MPKPAAALLALLPLASVAAASAPDAERPLIVGVTVSADIQTRHPYPAGDASYPVVERLSVSDPGATHLTLHFSRLELAPDDFLVVRDPGGRVAHRYQGRGPWGTGELWSLSVPGDAALVELHAGPGGGGFGAAIDSYTRGFVPVLVESICGADDKRDVACYQASHPTHYDRARAVGRLMRNGSALCTGSLISCESHFLTNQHCAPTDPTNLNGTEVWFNYQRPTCGAGNPASAPFMAASFVAVDYTLDYWLFTLRNDPQAQFGFLQLDPRPAVQDEAIYIPQHPGGVPKQLAITSDSNAGGLCAVDRPSWDGRGLDTDLAYMCDTLGGSSGSPVLAASSHKLLALHHFGVGSNPCTPTAMNSGIRIEHIAGQLGFALPGCSFCAPLPAPAGVAAAATQPNQVTVSWNPVPGAASYLVWRSDQGCAGPFQPIATVAGSPYVHAWASGGTSYGYQIEARDATGCRGLRSTCSAATATGGCALAPSFAGLERATSGLASACSIDLAWQPATGACSANVAYNVYRSTTSGFQPGPANAVATCLAGTGFTDTTVAPGVRYFYVVRAEDRGSVGPGTCGGGAEDANLRELSGRAVDGTPVTTFQDGAEAAPRMTLEAPWAVSTGAARTGAASYRVPGDTPLTCASLSTPPLVVTSGSAIGYSTRLENIELDTATTAWDGGVVEVSADNGGTWTRLVPAPPYPATFAGNSVACANGPGTDGTYSGNNLAWTDATADLSPWAGQEVIVRFRFSTDGSVDSTAWWIDDVRVTGVADAPCTGLNQPPGEVSPVGATHRFLLAKRAGGQVEMSWQRRPEALGYNVYQGDLGRFFNHGQNTFACDPATSALGGDPDHRTVTLTTGTGSHYYYVSAWNGDPVNGQEGTIGAGRPASESTCAPVNNN